MRHVDARVARWSTGPVLLALAVTLGTTSPAPRPAAARGPAIQPASASDLIALARKPGASATLLNVWASWCVPCRQEFPEILRLGRSYRGRGLRLALVSADFDAPAARAFLVKQGVSFRTYLKTGDDMTFINTLSPRWSGALPATLVYDGAGQLVSFWEGKADSGRLEQAVREAMGRRHDPHPKEKTP